MRASIARRAGLLSLVLTLGAGCSPPKPPPSERTPAPTADTPAPSPAPAPEPAAAPDPAAAPAPDPVAAPLGSALLRIPDDAPTNASSCETREAFARTTMQQLVDAATGTCDADAECAAVLADTGCFGACWSAISSTNLVEFREAQESIDQRVCTGYLADGCRYEGPSCTEQQAVCEQGRCALRQLPR